MFLANLMEQIGSSKAPVEESLVRHMVLNTIRANVRKFRGDYGNNIVIACDDRKYWRKDIFPFYKAHRKQAREDSGHDWESIFECLGKVRSELMEFSPYKVIQINRAEADDIIGVLAKFCGANEKVLILSSDKDFVQLQVNPNISQYSPIMKKDIKSKDPGSQLKELIIRGDIGDGIPNILSPDNSIVDGIRQKPVTKKRLDEMMNTVIPVDGNEELKRNWARNQQLIDLSQIPKDIVQTIIDRYEEVKPATRNKFMDYLIAMRLKNLLEVVDEF